MKSKPRAVVYYVEAGKGNVCDLTSVTALFDKEESDKYDAAFSAFQQWSSKRPAARETTKRKSSAKVHSAVVLLSDFFFSSVFPAALLRSKSYCRTGQQGQPRTCRQTGPHIDARSWSWQRWGWSSAWTQCGRWDAWGTRDAWGAWGAWTPGHPQHSSVAWSQGGAWRHPTSWLTRLSRTRSPSWQARDGQQPRAAGRRGTDSESA